MHRPRCGPLSCLKVVALPRRESGFQFEARRDLAFLVIRGTPRVIAMPEFTDKEQDGVELLFPAAVKLRHAIAIAAKAGVRLQVEHPNIQRPTHMDILPSTPIRVGVDGLWIDIETEPE